MEVNVKSRIKNAVIKLCEHHKKENLERFRENKSLKIYLGRLFGLGAWFQYFLAEELFKDTQYTVLVDCPVSIKGRKNPLYPDILVIDDDQYIKGLIDVKFDLGYVDPKKFGLKIKKGGEFSYYSSENKFLEKYNDFFEAEQFQYKLKNEFYETEDKKEIEIPKQVHKIAIVLMGNVNSHNRYKGYKAAMEDAGFKFLHILWNGNARHPNDEENMRLIEKEIIENNDIEKVLKPLFKEDSHERNGTCENPHEAHGKGAGVVKQKNSSRDYLKAQNTLSIKEEKMSSKHRWNEDDDIIALYLCKFNEEDIPYSYEDIANIRGFSVDSLKCAIGNFEAIDTEGRKGFKNYANHQMNTYKKYNGMSKGELKGLVLKILSKET